MTARLLLALMVIASPAFADDADDLNALLSEFLENVDSVDMHQRFWAEDLVYTSSAGLRFGKETIIAGFDAPTDAVSSTRYGAEDVDIRVFGDTAVVAFRLIGTDADGAVQEYFNTGTFVRRVSGWRAVAWQATRIPKDTE